jgi:hypothetical protein
MDTGKLQVNHRRIGMSNVEDRIASLAAMTTLQQVQQFLLDAMSGVQRARLTAKEGSELSRAGNKRMQEIQKALLKR